MKITQHYSADSQDVLSWDELKVGAIYFHIWLQTVNMKTSKNSYISFYDMKYHTRSIILRDSDSKVYKLINATFEFELPGD